MLEFLIMHVRGQARAEPKLGPSSLPPADATICVPPTDNGPLPGASSFAEENGSSGWPAVTGVPRNAVRNVSRSLADRAMLLLLSCCVGLLDGCACLNRDGRDTCIVKARQLSIRGIDAQKCGKWDEAESLLSQALQENPVDERAHQYYAHVMWQQGRGAEATSHMEESVRLSGGDPQLLVQLGEMYLKQGNLNAAWECAEEAVGTNRRLPCAWALRGDVLRCQHKWDLALESYHRALSEQPQYQHVQLAAAAVYREQNRPRRALATLDSVAMQLRPDEFPLELSYEQGLAYKALGRYDDAVNALSIASQHPDANADVLYHLGEAQFLTGNAASAALAVQAALDQNPGHFASLRLKERIDRQNQVMTASLKR